MKKNICAYDDYIEELNAICEGPILIVVLIKNRRDTWGIAIRDRDHPFSLSDEMQFSALLQLIFQTVFQFQGTSDQPTISEICAQILSEVRILFGLHSTKEIIEKVDLAICGLTEAEKCIICRYSIK
jgi:hypothetical protein